MRGALRAFQNLDIRKVNFQPAYGAARTFGDNQSNFIEVYTSGQSLINTLGSLYHTLLVHELGHVLEKRNDPDMINKAQTSFDFIERGPSNEFSAVSLEKISAQWIPETYRETVTNQIIYLQGTYPPNPEPGDGYIVEYIADHFVFWVYQDEVFGSTNIDEGDSPSDIKAAMIFIFGGAYTRRLPSTDKTRISFSPGMDYWINKA